MKGRLFLAGIATFVALSAVPASAAPAVVTGGTNGDASVPVWYHDSTVVSAGPSILLAWKTASGDVDVRSYNPATKAWRGAAVKVSATTLATSGPGAKDDAPSLLSDPAGRAYALYGGGTASSTGSGVGPFFRAATKPNSISAWGPEQRLPVPGSAHDFEAVRDNLGRTQLIGQQGSVPGGAGSLVYLRLNPGTSTKPGVFSPSHVLVQGGFVSSACAWQTTPGCNIYVSGRIAVGPAKPGSKTTSAPLYVAWVWQEGKGSQCADPAGFCNHGLYAARSVNGGATWTNLAGTASTTIAGAGIAYNDVRYSVVAPSADVGEFLAVAVTGAYPGTLQVAYQPNADLGTGSIVVGHRSSGSWQTQTVSSGNWNNHLVMRATGSKLYLWADRSQSATGLKQWSRPISGASWAKASLDVGTSWFLTGRAVTGGEALVWRGPVSTGTSTVDFTIVPTP